ncbi:MAG: 2Fe-2S iron-sulfur cluster binding domain-containing protein [Opitutus sp.]|nr:2Fe-2S iron-sulfur cluster binding domain-containing protein [Opitutus sp.]MCS6248248.1 2Fe-2S iron-sulfur cluster binding domain-containing protein [Opitutus sp.]MCS6274876.1 2Fe-2S iron-sulfur cluster binding domain-containing protein [Opitutus sp.]MCS6276467.1 2Fe-2S iron-sulfur cluster binding domain-containing protein [Opitutus sp.]MCS6301885.1 2Fe-2S iron-sulfur cluster binding domain-containing protein [Opitutus sp.]
MSQYIILSLGLILVALVVATLGSLLVAQLRALSAQKQAQAISLQKLSTELLIAQKALKKAETGGSVWSGVRKFSVIKKVPETSDATSFYLAPHDKKPLPPFKPGQYLTFELDIPNQKKKTIRCYSLSDAILPDYYRVTIKRCPPSKPEHAAGLASNFFHDSIHEGAILDVKAPGGHFFLDTNKQSPVVLISGGVGITPCLSMMNEIIQNGSRREIWWFYGVRHGGEHIMKEHVAAMAAKYSNISLHVCYSNPTEDDKLGADYQHHGRVGVDLFKKVLPSNNFDYYMCGPGPMMESVVKGLAEWGVPDDKVHYEAFGPASVKKAAPVAAVAADAGAKPVMVTFAKSSKSVAWNPEAGNLLAFAESQGVAIASGCCAGQCGTCVTAIRSGDVTYAQEPGSKPEPGSCLACVAAPKGDVVLDA